MHHADLTYNNDHFVFPIGFKCNEKQVCVYTGISVCVLYQRFKIYLTQIQQRWYNVQRAKTFALQYK